MDELRELERRPEGAGAQVFSAAMVIAKYRASGRQRAQAEREGARVFVQRGLEPAAKAKIRSIERQRRPVRAPAIPEPPAPAIPGGAVPDPVLQDPVEREKLVVDATLLQLAEEIGGPGHGVRVNAAAVRNVQIDPGLGQELLAMASKNLGPGIAVRVERGSSPAERENPDAITMMLIDTDSRKVADDDAFVLNTTPNSGRSVELDGVRAVFYS